MSESIKYEDSVRLLLDQFPDLGPLYEVEQRWWGPEESPPPYIVYESFVHPLLALTLGPLKSDVDWVEDFRRRYGPSADTLVESLGHPEPAASFLARFFDFCERMVSFGDDETANLIGIAVCEWLAGYPALREKAEAFMKPATLKSYWESLGVYRGTEPKAE